MTVKKGKEGLGLRERAELLLNGDEAGK